MANSKTIGRIVYVDPNDFDGQDSSTNVSVPIEDLSIYVELTTEKKARTILTTTKDPTIGVNNIGSETQGVSVRFIEGSLMDNGERVLTTKYTEMTQISTDDNQGETLGISSIDIDFNSSYAPLITINFIDVRGSSIFQNEDNLTNGNKYATFFQLPYPMFTLTIKGYYGYPVSYCLHMTKFNAKFNSQTGNFEIIANFIGYTYAMLSDMLLGYLKAVAYTDLGREKYKELRDPSKGGDPTLLTLNELMKKISEINLDTTKINYSDPDSAQLASAVNKQGNLNDIKSNLLILGQSIDIRNDLSEYPFIIINPSSEETNVDPTNNVFYQALPVNQNYQIIQNYITNVTENIGKYNENNKITINPIEDFTQLKEYKSITLRMLDPNTNIYDYQLKTIFGNPNQSDFNTLKSDLYDYVVKYYGSGTNNAFTIDQIFNVYDLTKQYNVISDKSTAIDKQIGLLKTSLGNTLRASVKNKLGFDPTVRNIVNVFTSAVEVFIYALYVISKRADDPTNEKRYNQLSKFKGVVDAYDIKTNSLNQTNNNSASGPLALKFYPWPDYRVVDENGGIIEKYLGGAKILDKPSQVDELAFIDDLLKGFLSAQAETNAAAASLNQNTTNWFPVNPLDTKLFTSIQPYNRIEANTYQDVINLMVTRAITYLGFSNIPFSSLEIQAMAEAETNAVMSQVSNDVVLQSITQFSADTFLNIVSNINTQVIPVSDSFNGVVNPTNSIDKANSGTLLLTDYSTSDLVDTNGNKIIKSNDGGIYIKFFDPKTYRSSTLVFPLPTTSLPTSNVLNLDTLKKDISVFPQTNTGLNPMGGTFGIQEFVNLEWGKDSTDDVKGLPFMYVFYQNSNTSLPYDFFNGFALTRAASKKPNDVYDIAKPTFIPAIGLISKSATHYKFGKNRELVNSYLQGSQDITYPYINFQIDTNTSNDGPKLASISLFGSRFYYEQTSDKAKAFLFLHTFPFNGLFMDSDGNNSSIFNTPEIYNTFGIRAGFISAPKLWVAFIGGLLWRADDSSGQYSSGPTDPIVFTGGTINNIETLIPKITSYPTRTQYLTKHLNNIITTQMTFSNTNTSGNYYVGLETMLLGLPEQAKDQFKQAFFDFVSSNSTGQISDWQIIKSQLEIFNGTPNQWKTVWNDILASANGETLNTGVLKANLNNTIENYIICTPYLTTDLTDNLIPNIGYEYNYFLELRDGTQAVKSIMDLFKSEVIIANMSPKIWVETLTSSSNPRSPISVSINDLKIYFEKVVNVISVNRDSLLINNKNKIKEQEVFNTDDEALIKFQLYRTCKNIYDKWIGGSSSDDILFQCGARNSLDQNLANNRANSKTDVEIRLIDSFRFVTRAFKDIGNDLYINPIPVSEYLINNPNSSFYDCVSSLLVDNNFDFIPLPSYINYNNPDNLKSIFSPMNTWDSLSGGTYGPSFVCVYLGQKSKHLDFKNSEYTNDGFDVRPDKNGNIFGIPKDLAETPEKYENSVAVFAVNYSQQNQNIFKDITLDQSEFTETAESLQIVDDISKKGAENHKTFGGQNMYNVYSVRSYKSEVEMMGNAMVQPMMYFQLNNIPMFHGAYMIIHVKHHITPNFMSTHFTGVRIRKPLTELMKASDLFMSLLDSIKASDAAGTAVLGAPPRNISSSYPPIIATIIETGGFWGDSSSIDTKPIPQINGVYNTLIGLPDKNILLRQAVDSLVLMANDWIAWMKRNGFSGKNGNYFGITSAFRDLATSQAIYDKYGSPRASSPGTGNHGWAIAIDLQMYTKNGDLIPNTQNTPKNFDTTYNIALKWLLDNSYRYGWISPIGLRDGAGTIDEHWHYEYHGTSALCLYQKNPTTYGYTATINQPLLGTTKNPNDVTGNEAIYTTCDYVTLPIGDNTEITLGNDSDYWTLLAICSLEASLPQARADVAQSIYNRLAVPKQPYGHSIKEIITSKGQYQPTFNNTADWLLINDETSAIVAVKNAKGWNDTKAKQELSNTKNALLDPILQNNSKSFIETRTEFLAYPPKSLSAIGIVQRSGSGNNVFFWEYSGKVLMGQVSPSAPNWNALNVNINLT